MNEIWEQLGNRKIGFLRFNPDEFTNKDDGTEHPGIFEHYRVSSGERRILAKADGGFDERM